jgi:sulfur carrier protein
MVRAMSSNDAGQGGPRSDEPEQEQERSGELEIELVVNGQPRQIASGATVKDLIAALGLAGKPVAVERNREVVPRGKHGETPLAAGDRIEVVTFVGGG